MDGGIAGRDRAHADRALGVERGQLVEGAVGLEHVAFGADLAHLAERAAGEQAVVGRRGRTRQAPADAAFLEDHRGRVRGDDALGDFGVLLVEAGAFLVGHLRQLEVGGKFVHVADRGLVGRDVRRQDRERAEVRAARQQEGASRGGVARLAESLEEPVALAAATIVRGVLEGDARLGDVAVGLRPDPGAGDVGGNLDPPRRLVGLERDFAPGLPPAVAEGVDLQREGRGRRPVVREEDRALGETGEEEGVGGDAGFRGFVHPHAAPAEGRAELVRRVERGEPEVGLRLAGAGERALGGTLVEELRFGGVVATEDEATLPRREVADDLEVGGARRDAGGLLGREVRGELPEEPVHGHQARAFLADVADARPFGVPAVCAVVRVAALRQAVARPLAVFHHHEDDRAEIPADGPDRILGRVGVAGEAAGPGDFGELVAADERPVACAVEGAERAARDRRVDERLGALLAVVRDDDLALARVESLAVVAGQRRRERRGAGFGGLAGLGLVLDLLDQAFDREGADIHLVEAVLHGREVDLVRRVREVTGVAGVAAGHELRGDDPHRAVRADEIRPDDQLVRLLVDHAVRRRAPDAFGAHDQPEVGRDLVELVARAVRQVRTVGDDPQAIGPRHDGAGAAFAFVVEVGELGVDAGPFLRRGGEGQGRRHGGDPEESREHPPTFRLRRAWASLDRS